MSPPRKPKRRRIRRWLEFQQARKRKSAPSLTENRCCDHLYATRSKSVRNIAVEMVTTDVPVLSKKLSDDSVIYLGYYRKIPELINLEDNDDNYEEKMTKQPEKITNQPEKITSKSQADDTHRKKNLTETNTPQYRVTKKCSVSMQRKI